MKNERRKERKRGGGKYFSNELKIVAHGLNRIWWLLEIVSGDYVRIIACRERMTTTVLGFIRSDGWDYSSCGSKPGNAPLRSKNLSHSSLMRDSHHSVVLSFVVPFISSRFSSCHKKERGEAP
jgi:hypothetical protein